MPHDDFAVEPIKGLPEMPPEGEVILWQGRPNWWALSKESLNLYWVLGYFVLLAAWRFLSLSDLMPLGRAFAASVPFLFLGALVAGLLMLTAFIQANATVYTVTNRRVAMRIGAALTVTLNLPYTQIANATLAQRKDGAGSIALELMAESKLSYLVCWPHVRAWYIAKPQPCLRCISNPQEVADILAKAAKSRVSSVQSQDRSLASHALPAE